MRKYWKRKWRNSIKRNDLHSSFLLFLILFNIIDVQAQEKLVVKNIKGSYIISNITPELAKEEAILDAKRNALRGAGVVENIYSLDALNSYSEKDIVNQSFVSFSTIELNGAIFEWSIVNEEKIIDEFNNLIYTVYIDAVIVKYSTNIDKEFTISIVGLKDVYREGDAISFSLNPTKSCYIKVFLIESSDAVDQIYPNKYEDNIVFIGGKEYQFPLNDRINYSVNLTNPFESNLLLVIATKKNISFDLDVNYNNIWKWVNGIELDEKYVIAKLISLYAK